MVLTNRQSSVLHAIGVLTAQLGWPPTERELAGYTGLSATRIRQHLEALEHRGAIHRDAGTARGIRVVSEQLSPG